MNIAAHELHSVQQRYAILEVGARKLGLDIRHLNEVCVVQEILPLVSTRPEVLGALNVRGAMIPLLDSQTLCGGTAMPVAPKLAAILEYEGSLIALGIDRPSAISKFKPAQIQGLYRPDATPLAHVRSGVISDGDSINLIEPASIFSLPDLPSCKASVRAKRQAVEGSAKAFLAFEAGGALFSLEAVRIFGTVPRQDVDIGALTGGDCLGTIIYQGRRIPIMDATRVFGLGSGLTQKQPEIVVMRYPNDLLLGFAVDVICGISMTRTAQMRPPPGIFDKAETLFAAVQTREEDGRNVFMLHADRLTMQPDLARMASLSDRSITDAFTADAVDGQDGTRNRPEEGRRDISYDVIRCIVFTAGVQVAVEISQVVSILEMPEFLAPFNAADPAILGLFAHSGSTVPLISMPHQLGHAEAPQDATRRVLLVGPPDRRVGFCVNSVDGIANSDFLAKADHDMTITDRIAKLKGDEFKRVLPYVDLDRMAARITLPAK